MRGQHEQVVDQANWLNANKCSINQISIVTLTGGGVVGSMGLASALQHSAAITARVVMDAISLQDRFFAARIFCEVSPRWRLYTLE